MAENEGGGEAVVEKMEQMEHCPPGGPSMLGSFVSGIGNLFGGSSEKKAKEEEKEEVGVYVKTEEKEEEAEEWNKGEGATEEKKLDNQNEYEIVEPALGKTEEAKDELEDANAEEEDGLFWLCEFCDTVVPLGMVERDELPLSATVDYLLEPAPPRTENKAAAKGNIVFVIDVSGSMCVTTEVSGQVSLREPVITTTTSHQPPPPASYQPSATPTNHHHQRKRESGLSPELMRGAGSQFMPGQRRNTKFVSRLDCVKSGQLGCAL